MKTTALFVGIVSFTLFTAASANSQGTVTLRAICDPGPCAVFVTYTNSTVIGPIANGAKPSAAINVGGYGGINARAGLYAGPNGTSRDGLILLLPVVGFRTGAAAGYINPGTDPIRTVPGVPGGAQATLQFRAWDAGVAVDSYEAAVALCSSRLVYLGESPLLNNITLGNYIPPGGTPTPPAVINTAFAMDATVPEPATFALGLLSAMGLGLLLFRRRK